MSAVLAVVTEAARLPAAWEELHRIRDPARVLALGVDIAVAIEQRVAGHAYVVEPDHPVVHSVEPELLTAVLDPDAFADLAALVADRCPVAVADRADRYRAGGVPGG